MTFQYWIKINIFFIPNYNHPITWKELKRSCQECCKFSVLVRILLPIPLTLINNLLRFINQINSNVSKRNNMKWPLLFHIIHIMLSPQFNCTNIFINFSNIIRFFHMTIHVKYFIIVILLRKVFIYQPFKLPRCKYNFILLQDIKW